MTKQEQIEEITRIIDSDICDKDCPNRCPYCGGLSSREAENIYNAGYRKTFTSELTSDTQKAFKDTYMRLTDRDTNKVCFDMWELCGLDYVCKRDCCKPTPCKIPAIIKRLAAFEDLIENGSVIMAAKERDEEIDAVRKETAKEILDKLNALMEQYHYKSTAWRNCANFIKETYGVEVNNDERRD